MKQKKPIYKLHWRFIEDVQDKIKHNAAAARAAGRKVIRLHYNGALVAEVRGKTLTIF